MGKSRNRRIGSVKEELLSKSCEAMMAAVQIYNNPQITFKSEAFITLSVIAWTYLLHAYYRNARIEYRYFKTAGKTRRFEKTKNGAHKYWELERCLNEKRCPLDNDIKNNLKFLIGIRHEIEHQMTSRIDDYLSAKLQACALNFEESIVRLFGERYSISKNMSFAIQLSSFAADQVDQLKKISKQIPRNVNSFITKYEAVLTDNQLKNPQYAFHLLLTPIVVNRKGQADGVFELIQKGSEASTQIDRILLKGVEKPKFRATEIVRKINEAGFPDFKIYSHTMLWRKYDAKNPAKGFSVELGGQWFWYENWLEFVKQCCEQERTNKKDARQ